MPKFDFYAEKIIINNDDLTFINENEKFLNLFYGNLYKKSKILNKFKGQNSFIYKSFFVNENKNDFEIVRDISGICDNMTNIKKHIKKLPKYSFAVVIKFKLKAPYFSKDDDEFYIIQNPILKETNFKVPMIRGSSWKGALAHSFRRLFDNDDKKEKIESFLRIFGAGSESIKAIENYILDKNKDLKKVKENLLEFIIFELGLKVEKKLIDKIKNIKNKNDLINIIKEELSKKLENEQRESPIEFQTHKGRTIFYPTYFDKLSLEIINPHDRKKRAGINPIHYEVVPKDTEGILQLIYIPFDGILKTDDKLRKEAKEDLENLCKAIEILANKGIGAKTKLGWGRFKILDKMI